MRYLVLVAIVIICVALSCGVFSTFNLFGAVPDLMICCLVGIAFSERSNAVLFMGVSAGLLTDILFSEVIGMYAIPYLVISYIILILAIKIRFNDKVITPAIIAFAVFFLKDFLSMMLAYLFGSRADITYMLIRYTLIGAAVTAVLTPIIYFLMRKLFAIRILQRTRFDDLKHL